MFLKAWQTPLGERGAGKDVAHGGFTLVELLVTLAVMLLVMGAIFTALQRVTRGTAHSMAATKLEMDRASNLALLRLDIMHAGYGVDKDEQPLTWNGSTLSIRSTLNNLDTSTMGWVLVNCTSTSQGWSTNATDQRQDKNTNSLVFLDPQRDYVGNVTSGSSNCPATGTLIGYPFHAAASNNCTQGFCELIQYSLSSTQSLSECNPNTGNLLRVDYRPGKRQVPVLDCVADWKLSFDIDSNGDGVVDSTVTSFTDAREVKLVHVYILVQEGKFDPDYTYSGNTTAGGIKVGNITLSLPSGFKNYHWRVVQFDVDTLDL